MTTDGKPRGRRRKPGAGSLDRPEKRPSAVKRAARLLGRLLGEDPRDTRLTDRSGPLVATLFHRLLAVVFGIAWLSLGAQVHVLMGSRGLLPLAPFIDAVRSQDFSLLEVPTIFLWASSDAALTGGIAAGLTLAAAAFFGLAPRLCFGLSTLLYLSYATAGRTFLAFQWDNLLLECGALAALLPRDAKARWAHVLFRVLLFKLYWESGVAKWQSPLHDWHDGSAMTFYFETAPLPTRLAHAAHALPAAWHHVEAWLTLALELVVPLAIFGPRWARLSAFAAFTGFQVVNAATANYGFFCYLSGALHVFLLGDRDLARARSWLERRIPWLRRSRARLRALRLLLRRRARLPWSVPLPRRRPLWLVARRSAALALFAAYVGLCALEGAVRFGGETGRDLAASASDLRELYTPLRLVNNYHLFAAITRDRIEPEVQTSDGETWTAHDLRYKPGALTRPPPLVAPHQPRLDFQLWFYGLGHSRGIPAYVRGLLENVCRDPDAVADLFEAPLPASPTSARIAFWRYKFTTPAERSATGAWWSRTWVGATPAQPCAP
jgi:hypothetical protein